MSFLPSLGPFLPDSGDIGKTVSKDPNLEHEIIKVSQNHSEYTVTTLPNDTLQIFLL